MLCVRDGVHHKPKIVDTWLFILVMWICACLNGFMNYCLNNCMNNCMNGPNLKIQGADYFNLQGDLSDAAIENIMVKIRAEAERRKALASQDPPP